MMIYHYYKIFYKVLLLLVLMLLSLALILQKCTTIQSQKLINNQFVSAYLDVSGGFTPDHVVYYVNGSTSTMASTIHMLNHSIPSVAHIFRSGITNFPAHVDKLSEYHLIIDTVKAWIENDPSVKILFVTDIFGPILNRVILGLNLPADQVHTILLEEGTSIYNPYFEINAEYYQGFVDMLSLETEELRKNPTESTYSDTTAVFAPLLSKHINRQNIPQSTVSFGAVYPWYFYPERLFEGPYQGLSVYFTKEEFDSSFNKLDLFSYFHSLSLDKKEELKKMSRLYDKVEQPNGIQESPEEIFTQGDKKLIVIALGIKSFSANRSICAACIQHFGEGYEYVIKSHPSSTENFIRVKETRKILNKSIPLEAILLNYSDNIYAVVGEESSVFLSVPESIKIYFYAKPRLEPFRSLCDEKGDRFLILP